MDENGGKEEDELPVFDVRDVMQRALGDCWLVSAMAAASLRFPLFSNLFRVTKRTEVGIYQVRLCVGGVWTVVTVDDCLPATTHGQLVFTRGSGRQLWPALYEKAVAKTAGSFQGVVGGTADEGLRLVTGLPVLTLATSTGRTDSEQSLWDGLRHMRTSSERMTRMVEEITQDMHVRRDILVPRPAELLPRALPPYALPRRPFPWGEAPSESPVT
jgi:hypothetical protein